MEKEITPVQTQTVNRLLHELIFGLRLDRLGFWSKSLDNIIPVDLHLLKIISEKPDVIIGEIRDALGIPGSTLSSMINRLERRGMLKRVISDRDLRSYGLKLTAFGKKIQAEHERVDRLMALEILKALPGAEERETLISLLTRVVEGLKVEVKNRTD